MHGELARSIPAIKRYNGSSPRAWGTHFGSPEEPGKTRFIPTCMGNSLFRGRPFRVQPVHPHVHGELLNGLISARPCAGSSPRAWGTPRPIDKINPLDRFIPTCMGNSPPHPPLQGDISVHPHVHGELKHKVEFSPLSVGSSPRAWGTQNRREVRREMCRFIPTCMGNSVCAPIMIQSIPVHPHVHGELALRKEPLSVISGSSPRAWGTRFFR